MQKPQRKEMRHEGPFAILFVLVPKTLTNGPTFHTCVRVDAPFAGRCVYRATRHLGVVFAVARIARSSQLDADVFADAAVAGRESRHQLSDSRPRWTLLPP